MPIAVVVNDSAVPSRPRQAATHVGFLPPVVSDVVFNENACANDQIITINGDNFGCKQDKIAVQIDGEQCANLTLNEAHTTVSCQPPRVNGPATLTITVGGQTSTHTVAFLKQWTCELPSLVYWARQAVRILGYLALLGVLVVTAVVAMAAPAVFSFFDSAPYAGVIARLTDKSVLQRSSSWAVLSAFTLGRLRFSKQTLIVCMTWTKLELGRYDLTREVAQWLRSYRAVPQCLQRIAWRRPRAVLALRTSPEVMAEFLFAPGSVPDPARFKRAVASHSDFNFPPDMEILLLTLDGRLMDGDNVLKEHAS